MAWLPKSIKIHQATPIRSMRGGGGQTDSRPHGTSASIELSLCWEMVDSCESIFLPVFLFWKIAVCMWIPFFLSACCEVCLAWYGMFVSNPVTHASVVLYLCLIWYCILKKHRILIPRHIIWKRNPLLISQPLVRPNWAVSISWGQTERRPRLFTGTKWHVSSLGLFEIPRYSQVSTGVCFTSFWDTVPFLAPASQLLHDLVYTSHTQVKLLLMSIQ